MVCKFKRVKCFYYFYLAFKTAWNSLFLNSFFHTQKNLFRVPLYLRKTKQANFYPRLGNKGIQFF